MTETLELADRPRTLAAARLPRPDHQVFDVALPLYLTPGALITIDGGRNEIDQLIAGLDYMIGNKPLWTPPPLITTRPSDCAADCSRRVIQPALRDGVPVIAVGPVTEQVVVAGEPRADLSLRVLATERAVAAEPILVGSVRNGFSAVLTGADTNQHLLAFFDALLQASLAGISPRQAQP
jgi:hypothetical protein